MFQRYDRTIDRRKETPMNTLFGLLAIAAVVVTGKVTYQDMFQEIP